MLLACASDDMWCLPQAYYVPALVYGAIGAAIGTGIDALVGKKVLVYERRLADSGARLRLSPIVDPRRQGVAVTLGF